MATVESPAVLCLHHGTDLDSANDLLANGLDSAKAAAYNVSGEFWATTNPQTANTFAQVNPAGGPPARFDFDIPVDVLQTLLAETPPVAYPHGTDWFEFLPACFADINQHRTNQQVVPLP
jgi:hypothetical protein